MLVRAAGGILRLRPVGSRLQFHLRVVCVAHRRRTVARGRAGEKSLRARRCVKFDVFSGQVVDGGGAHERREVLNVRAGEAKCVDLGELAIGWVSGHELSELVECRVHSVHAFALAAVRLHALPLLHAGDLVDFVRVQIVVRLARAGTPAGAAIVRRVAVLLVRLAHSLTQRLATAGRGASGRADLGLLPATVGVCSGGGSGRVA